MIPLLIVLGLYFYCKRKRLTSRLEYEVMEVRSFNSRGNNKNTSYAALANNNE